MPFQEFLPRSFRAMTVQREAPPLSGIYGLSNAREWIYVGEADNIQAALLAHLTETGTLLAGRLPTGFSFEVCPRESRQARQRRLIQELKPVFNQHRAGSTEERF